MPRKLDTQLHSSRRAVTVYLKRMIMATCDLSLAVHYPLQETKDHGNVSQSWKPFHASSAKCAACSTPAWARRMLVKNLSSAKSGRGAGGGGATLEPVEPPDGLTNTEATDVVEQARAGIARYVMLPRAGSPAIA